MEAEEIMKMKSFVLGMQFIHFAGGLGMFFPVEFFDRLLLRCAATPFDCNA